MKNTDRNQRRAAKVRTGVSARGLGLHHNERKAGECEFRSESWRAACELR
jgi:hypothetical protein